MIADITRLETSEEGTIGILRVSGLVTCYTFELPWKDNKRNISCIPSGQYECEKVKSKSFGNTFEIKNVCDRSNILFHWGNTAKDFKGCIGTGSRIGYLNNQRAILDSKTAFNYFYAKVESYQNFILSIRELY